jgi:hypothetical protein
MSERVAQSDFFHWIIFSMNTLIWIMQQLLFGFAGVYFLGQVLQAYEKNYPKLRMMMYKSKAQFNNESFDIMDMFIKQRNFKVICFALDKKLKHQYDEEWQGLTHSMKTFQTRIEEDKAEQRRLEKASLDDM